VSTPNPTTVVGYCRRSKESGAHTVSLEEQAAQIQRYAAQQGWPSWSSTTA
jgi:DNA invertase Pin-like site-specific DNA recombinase